MTRWILHTPIPGNDTQDVEIDEDNSAELCEILMLGCQQHPDLDTRVEWLW